METANSAAPSLPQIAPAPQPVNHVSLTWSTNYNGKMDTDAMLHIDLFPPGQSMPPPEYIKTTVYTISTRDGSHTPVQVLMDEIQPMRLGDLLGVITIASHGMSASEFRQWFLNQYRGATLNTMCLLSVFCKPTNLNVYNEFRKIGSLNGNYWIL